MASRLKRNTTRPAALDASRAVVLPAANPPASLAATAIVAIASALTAIVVFRGAFAYGFSQDDFLGLARASGLAEPITGAWRVLSGRVFWELAYARFGLASGGYHAWSVGTLALSAATLAALAARRWGGPAGLAVGVAYASHPSLYTSGYWISAQGDTASTWFALLATAAFLAPAPWRWAALPLFAIGLGFKETILALPLALAAWRAWGPSPRRAMRDVVRDPVLLGLAAVSIAMAVALASSTHTWSSTSDAYAVSAAAIPANLASYATWTVIPTVLAIRDVSDAVRPAFVIAGTGVLLAGVAGLAWRPWRERGAGAALLAWLLMLAPVLPLAHHAYRYYLQAPLAASGLAAAALFAALFARASRTFAWAGAIAVGLGCAIAGGRMIGEIERAPFPLPGLRADRTVDRALIASRAIESIRAARLPEGSTLTFWSSQAREIHAGQGGDPASESYLERNVRAALFDGLAVRVMLPVVDSVAFVRSFDGVAHPDWWAVYRPDGSLGVIGAGALDSLLRAHGAR